LPPDFERLAAAFWPGPMTLIAPVQEDAVPEIARAGLPTAAFRVPRLDIVQKLLEKAGPLLMPSANISGRPSSTCASHVEADFGSDFPVLDGGSCMSGMESTILHFLQGRWCISRLGALPPEVFAPVLGYVPSITLKAEGDAPLCPGQRYRHYAPRARLVLEGTMPSEAGSAIIGFDDKDYAPGCRLFSLGASSDAGQACHALYAVLRRLDEENIPQAWVDMDFPETGLWRTLRERLLKAGNF
jgi:L-threonylcarbamoyladenylate synthase